MAPTRSVVEAFYEAYAFRDAKKFAPFLADDVEWMITGPVELLQFCGCWKGKAAVIELYDNIVPHIFKVTSFTVQTLLVEGERAAALCKLSAVLPNGRSISYDLAQFVRFRDGKVVEFRSLNDTFNAAEQVMGREIELAPGVERQSIAVLSDVVPV
jgi:ketosteroid isomerase-like protein